jgi:hypothetical protein
VQTRRILSARQTLIVRPQPERALRLEQKIRRARTAFSLEGVAVVAAQKAMPNERADGLAVRTRGQLELLNDCDPFVVVAEKPARIGHGVLPKIAIVAPRRGAG